MGIAQSLKRSVLTVTQTIRSNISLKSNLIPDLIPKFFTLPDLCIKHNWMASYFLVLSELWVMDLYLGRQ